MNKTLENILLDWIGEDIAFPERESDEYDAGHAKALSDLRARVPDLIKKIAKENEKTLLNNVVIVQDHGQFFKKDIFGYLTLE